jgi:fluoride exporter
MTLLKNILLIGTGGALGSVLRYLTGIAFGPGPFPYATLFINITGSFIIGLVCALALKNENFAVQYKLFLATGFCGGFTTFSAFSLENVQMLQQGKYAGVFIYATISLILGIAATVIGYKIIGGN